MKYKLLLPNPNRDTNTVQFITFINKKRVKIGTGIKIETKTWDSSKQCIKAKTKNLNVLQGELDEVVNNIKKVHALMMVQDLEITPLTFKDAIKRFKEGKEGVSEATLTFNQWVKEFIKETADGKRTNQMGLPIGNRTVQKYNTVKKHLDMFSKKVWKREVRFEEIDSRFLEQYKKFRGDQGLGINTIAKDQAVIKTWMKEAYLRNVHTNKNWQTKAFLPKEIKVRKPTLTEEELQILADHDFTSKNRMNIERTALNKCRDHFLVACWTGVRISDLKRMPEIIKDAWKQNGNSCPPSLTFVQSKTKEEVSIPVMPELCKIIKKWKGNLPEVSAEQQMNKKIKEACEVAGLNRMIDQVSGKMSDGGKIVRVPLHELVSNHTARRTFATNIYKRGIMSNGQLMSLTGHNSEGAFLKYLDISRTEMSKVASRILLEHFNQESKTT
tara:strand:+ start:394 stop:1719 length:1326 start_codon:yes stop_codon:yes gene_type:complete